MLSLGLLLVATTSSGPLVSLAVLTVAVLVALLAARVPPRTYLFALLAPAGFVLLSAVVIAVHLGDVPGARWSWGPFAVTDASLRAAVDVAVRSIASFSAVLLLAMTTPMSDVLTGLRRLRVPEVLIDIAGLIYRMLFSLLGSATAIMEAQRARLGYASGRAARRSLGGLAGAVLTQAWNRARRLEAGLAGRGYDGLLRTLSVARPVSVPFVVLSVLVVAALAAASIVQAVLS